jgi:hypothetical protein
MVARATDSRDASATEIFSGASCQSNLVKKKTGAYEWGGQALVRLGFMTRSHE